MTARTMRALQLQQLGHLDEVQLPVPQPGTNEVLVRTAATTICTSDLQDIEYNIFGAPLPRVIGHEGAGFVAALGDGVQGLAVGDRVAAHPVISCGACETCRRGLGHLCDHMGHLGIDRGGTFAEYFCIPASRVRQVPESVEFPVAALLEPVSVCIEALRRARVSQGDTVLVLGDGPFGIIIARLAFRYRPRRVILVGHHEFRLKQVPDAVSIHTGQTPDVLKSIRDAADGSGVDAAILAAASAEAVDLCLQSLRPRGRLAVFSWIADAVPTDLFRVFVKELEILGACNDENFIDEALALLSDPSLQLAGIVTHRLPFADWPRAIELASQRKDEALKVAMVFGEEAK